MYPRLPFLRIPQGHGAALEMGLSARFLCCRVSLFSETVQKVEQCQEGMSWDHAGTSVSHHLPDLLPLNRIITMDLAIGAGCLTFLKGALVKTLLSIIPELFAFRADRVFGSAVMTAIDAYHSVNGTTFPYHPGAFPGHKNHVLSPRFLCLQGREVNLKSHDRSLLLIISLGSVWSEAGRKGESSSV